MELTSEEVKIIDLNCEELGISVSQLMENAGAAIARFVLEQFPSANRIILFCGIGNNGGDGFVAARHLASAKKEVLVILLGDSSKIRSTISKKNFQILEQMERSVKIINVIDSSNIALLKEDLACTDLIIDALLGIGLTSEPYEPIKSAIRIINNSGKPVLSVDLPSGMYSDCNQKSKHMINAERIITFHKTKPCLTLPEMNKKTIIANIGVPPEAEIFTGKGDLQLAIPKRNLESHKGQNGTVLVVGGCEKYSGAPILTSRAALRTGADLVVTCIPSVITDAVRSDSPNMIVRSFEGNFFSQNHQTEIVELISKFDSIVIGPGIGEHPETFDLILSVIKKIPKEKPMIIDADAIKALSLDISVIKEKKVIVTPHAGEFNILFGENLRNDLLLREKTVKEQAARNNLTILLKGKYDFISDGIRTKLNRTGHVGMTVGGTGDVLAGILGEIVAINKNLFRAACAAAYLAGKAGEYAATDFGNSLLATDVIEKIPEVLINNKIH